MRLPALLSDGRVVDFKLFTYEFTQHAIYYVIEKGDVKNVPSPLVRIHSACSFAHVLNSQRCDDKAQLDEAMLKIAESEAGLIIYAWPHEGRGVGMWDHTRVYVKQDEGEDTVSAYEALGLPIDSRDYGDCINILKDFGLKKIQLMTNNPAKVEDVKQAGIEVVRIPLIARLDKYNESQIKVKIEKLGHFYDLEKARTKSQVHFYEGIEGLEFLFQSMLEELTPNGVYYVLASGEMASTLGAYYDTFQKEKASRKIKSLILYGENMREKPAILEKTKGIKEFSPISSFSSDTFIYNDKVAIVSWLSTPPFAVLITSKETSESYKKIFNGFWGNIHELKLAVTQRRSGQK